MRLRSRLLAIALVPMLVAVALVAAFGYAQAARSLQEQRVLELDSVAHDRESKIEELLAGDLSFLDGFLGSDELRRHILALQADETRRQPLESFLTNITLESRFEAFHVMDRSGLVIASTRQDDLGEDHAGDAMFQDGLATLSVAETIVRQNTLSTLVAAGPLRGDQGTIGVLAGELSLGPFAALVLDRSTLGESGEAYLLTTDPSGRPMALSPLRQQQDSVIASGLATLALQTDGAMTTTSAKDYRGETVLAAAHVMPDLGWVVVVKQDRSEVVTGPAMTLLWWTGAAAGISLLVALPLAVVLTNRVLRPMQRLKDATDRASDQESAEGLEPSGIRELDALAQSFLHITGRLVESRNFLNNILDSSTEYAITVQDLRRRILLWNEGAHHTFGYLAHEMLGEDAKKLHAPQDVRSGNVNRVFARALKRGKAEGTFDRVHKDGRRLTTSDVVTRMEDAKGKPIGFVMISRDVTKVSKVQHSLMETRNFLNNILESSTEHGVVALDLDGRILSWNEGARRTYGYAHHDIIGKHCKRVFPRDDIQRGIVDDLLQEAYRHGKKEHRGEHVRRDGTRFTALDVITRRDGLDGRPEGYLLISRDITKEARTQDRLAETRNFLGSILESSTEYAIVAQDLEGTVLSWNLGAKRTYGYDTGQIVGRNVHVLHSEADIESGALEQLRKQALKEGKAEGIFRARHRDGGRFTVQVVLNRRLNARKETVGFVMIAKDVTEQVRLDELKQRSEELERQSMAFQEANRLKSEFLANMSHEIRTPLNSIIGFSKLMASRKAGDLAPRQEEFLQDILQSASHLLQIINDVLDLAKIEAGRVQLRPEEVELDRLSQEVLDILRPLVREADVQVETDIADDVRRVHLDATRLKQVLYNYLSNAIKFTGPKGTVTVRAKPHGPDAFMLEVEDTGIGISEEGQEQLFMEFHQLDAGSSKHYQGTGLGLALTKKIVEAHGGKVGVRSMEGEGSTFYALLPRHLQAQPEEAAPARGAHVLLVEDDDVDRAWMRGLLEESGFRVEGAESVRQARRRLESTRYRGLILDLQLPDGDGDALLRDVRDSDGPNHDTPTVVATRKRSRVRVHGADQVLHKPVSAKTLLAALEAAGVRPDLQPRLVLVGVTHELGNWVRDQFGELDVVEASDPSDGLQACREAPAAAIVVAAGGAGDGMVQLRDEAERTGTPLLTWAPPENVQDAGPLVEELKREAGIG